MPRMKALAVVEVQLMLAMPVPLAESGTVAVGLKGWQVRPEGTVSPRATGPTKLNVLVRVIEEEIDVLVAPLGDVALIVKSPTWTVDAAEGEAGAGEPAPVIVTPYVPGAVDGKVP